MTQHNLHTIRSFMIINGFVGKIYYGFGDRYQLIIRIKGSQQTRERLDSLLKVRLTESYQVQGLGALMPRPKGQVQIILPKQTGVIAWCSSKLNGLGSFFFDRE